MDQDNNPNGAGGAQPTDAEMSAEIKLDEFDPATATPEQVTDLLTKAKTLSGQKSHWMGKAIDPETKKPYRDIVVEVRKTNAANPPKSADAPEGLAKDVELLKQAEEKRQFGHKHGLAPEETDKLFGYAKGTGMRPEDALKDSFFEKGLEAHRTAARNSANTPSTSGRAPRVDGKSFSEMTPDERRKNLPEIARSLSKK